MCKLNSTLLVCLTVRAAAAQDGNAGESRVKLRHGDVLVVDTRAGRVQLDALRRLLAPGLPGAPAAQPAAAPGAPRAPVPTPDCSLYARGVVSKPVQDSMNAEN